MSTFSADQRVRFDKAVASFRERGVVRVTPETIRLFLERTQDIPATPADRLRLLAIELENLSFENGWSDLRKIYRWAAEADPGDSAVFHSWGIAARNWTEEWMTPNVSERVRIAEEAEGVLLVALDLSPRNSHIAHSLGIHHYNYPSQTQDPEQHRSQAIDWFSQAVEWDPVNVIAQLYLAHCYHDRKDWPRAIAEYERIDLIQLAHDWPAWRAVKCREQLAQCHAYAGNTDESVRQFAGFLDEVESWEDTTLEERVINVDELAIAVTDILDHPELCRRTRALVSRLGLEKRYQQLAWR